MSGDSTFLWHSFLLSFLKNPCLTVLRPRKCVCISLFWAVQNQRWHKKTKQEQNTGKNVQKLKTKIHLKLDSLHSEVLPSFTHCANCPLLRVSIARLCIYLCCCFCVNLFFLDLWIFSACPALLFFFHFVLCSFYFQVTKGSQGSFTLHRELSPPKDKLCHLVLSPLGERLPSTQVSGKCESMCLPKVFFPQKVLSEKNKALTFKSVLVLNAKSILLDPKISFSWQSIHFQRSKLSKKFSLFWLLHYFLGVLQHMIFVQPTDIFCFEHSLLISFVLSTGGPRTLLDLDAFKVEVGLKYHPLDSMAPLYPKITQEIWNKRSLWTKIVDIQASFAVLKLLRNICVCECAPYSWLHPHSRRKSEKKN